MPRCFRAERSGDGLKLAVEGAEILIVSANSTECESHVGVIKPTSPMYSRHRARGGDELLSSAPPMPITIMEEFLAVSRGVWSIAAHTPEAPCAPARHANPAAEYLIAYNPTQLV